MPECPCVEWIRNQRVEWIRNQPIPGKVIGFSCSVCKTQYTLFPNGEIMYEQRMDGMISCANPMPGQSGERKGETK